MWTIEIPNKCGYYWVLFKDKDSWLDGVAECIYIYNEGLVWKMFRPGFNVVSLSHYPITHWYGPLIPPSIEKEGEDLLSDWRKINGTEQ